MGADFETNGSTITVTGIHQVATTQTAEMNCCESGSTLRFLIPVAAALGVHATFHGQGRLPQRPITAYVRELSKNGITFDYHNTMPFTIHGQLQSGTYYLEGDVSSQYITGLLFALPLLKGDSEIIMLSPLQSKPYVDMTIACMQQFGFVVTETEQGYFVPGGQHAHACSGTVEGDYSQAAFFAVANAIGNQITMTNLNPDSVQGDKIIIEIAEKMCYNRNNHKPACFTLDAADIPDLVPILAVLATFGTHPSEIHGAARLKIKESDRLQATADLLNRLGGQVTILEDGLRIQPVERLHGGKVDSYGDHRIAMCAAIAATRCTAPVRHTYGSRLRMVVQETDTGIQHILPHNRVGIQQQHILSFGKTDSLIVGTRETYILFIIKIMHLRISVSDIFLRTVGRGVVHHPHIQFQIPGSPIHRTNGLLQIILYVKIDDNDG